MVVNVARMLMTDNYEMDIDTQLEIQAFELGGINYIVEQPVKVEGSLSSMRGNLHLNIKVSGEIKTNCYRCANVIKKEFTHFIKEAFKNENYSEKETSTDLINIQGNEINIGQIVANNILLNLEMRYLCKSECKGLCPICGKNLNIEKCECKKNNIDDRLKILENFFEN